MLQNDIFLNLYEVCHTANNLKTLIQIDYSPYMALYYIFSLKEKIPQHFEAYIFFELRVYPFSKNSL